MYSRVVADVSLERDEWMRRLGPLYPGLVALTTLTFVPLPRGLEPTDEDRARAAPWFPAVGAFVGLSLAIIAELLLWWRFSPALAALLVHIAAIAIAGTSALVSSAWTARELAQPSGKLTADLAHWLPGALAVVGILAVRIVALMAIATDAWFPALFFSEVMAYFCVLFAQYANEPSQLPGARESSPLSVGRISLPTLGMGSAIAGGATLVILVWSGVVALVATLLAVLVAFVSGLMLQRYMGRLPGTSLGAIAIVCGVVVIIAFAAAHPTNASPWVR